MSRTRPPSSVRNDPVTPEVGRAAAVAAYLEACDRRGVTPRGFVFDVLAGERAPPAEGQTRCDAGRPVEVEGEPEPPRPE